jgi:hypothetical protein
MPSRPFTVVIDEVERLATGLDTLAGRFDDAANRRIAYGGFADARPMEDGLGEFFGKWTDAMNRIHRQLTDLASHLHGAASTYGATERSIQDAARPDQGT